jgi:predicted branched-subunit amino acid permease
VDRIVSLKKGFWTGLPLTVSGGVFGLIFGFTGALGGLPLYLVSSMSFIIFAGSAQFITLLLFIQHEEILGIIIAATIINLRHLIYGAVLNEKINWKGLKKLIIGYFLTDEAFLATTIVEKEKSEFISKQMEEFQNLSTELVFLGAAITLWLTWNLTTILGYILYLTIGSLISFPENFVITASFVGFLVDHWRKYKHERYHIAALAILSIPFGFYLSSTWTLILLMVIGSGIASAAEYKRIHQSRTVTIHHEAKV